MWMSRSVGVHVFPTRVSEQIRSSPALIHYEIPSKDVATFDYDALRRPPKQSGLDYRPSTKRATPSECRSAPQGNSENEIQRPQRIEIVTTPKASTLSTNSSVRSSSGVEQSRKSPPATLNTPAAEPMRVGQPNATIEGESQGYEKILLDLDNALEEDEQMTFEEIRQKVKKMNLNFRQYASLSPEYTESPTDFAVNVNGDEEVQSGVIGDDGKPHKPHMDAEKSDSYASNVSAPVLSAEIIGELKNMRDGISALPRYREERRRQIAEKEKQMMAAIEQIKKEYTPSMFVDQTPEFFRNTTTPIPQWKRLMMAKGFVKEAIRQQEDAIRKDFEEWKQKFAPTFRPPPK